MKNIILGFSKYKDKNFYLGLEVYLESYVNKDYNLYLGYSKMEVWIELLTNKVNYLS